MNAEMMTDALRGVDLTGGIRWSTGYADVMPTREGTTCPIVSGLPADGPWEYVIGTPTLKGGTDG
jgi:hypothetical protein